MKIKVEKGLIEIDENLRDDLIEEIKDTHQGLWVREDGETMQMWCGCFGGDSALLEHADRFEQWSASHKLFQIISPFACGDGRLVDFAKDALERQFLQTPDYQDFKSLVGAAQMQLRCSGWKDEDIWTLEDCEEDVDNFYYLLAESRSEILAEIERELWQFYSEEAVEQISPYVPPTDWGRIK